METHTLNLLRMIAGGATRMQFKQYCIRYSNDEWANDYCLAQVAKVGGLPDNDIGWAMIDGFAQRFRDRVKYKYN